jgi:hypothetical protein
MKIHESFFDLHLKPACDEHKRFVLSVYPNSIFSKGFIYPCDGNYLTPILSTRWDIEGLEAEYYAWMWAAEEISNQMLRKLES